MVRKTPQCELTGHTVPTARKERATNAGTQLIFSFFIQSRTPPTHWMLLPTFRVNLPFSVEPGTPLQTHLDLCLLGDPKSSQVDNDDIINMQPESKKILIIKARLGANTCNPSTSEAEAIGLLGSR